MAEENTEEKIAKLEEDVKRLNKKIFPPKEAQTRGDPICKIRID